MQRPRADHPGSLLGDITLDMGVTVEHDIVVS